MMYIYLFHDSLTKLAYILQTLKLSSTHSINYSCVVFQIEREKADLSVQVIQLTERLEEAEGGAECAVSKKQNLI